MAAPRLCSVHGCRNTALARGWCRGHYKRWARHGSPTAGRPVQQASQASLCEVHGCSRQPYLRGWCNAHYKRWLRHGDPMAGHAPPGAPIAWLLAHVDYDGDECLIWPFSRSSYGYGMFHDPAGGKTTASRYMCQLVHGAPPSPKYDAAHDCGRGHAGCTHPRHLRWATRAENIEDMISHGTICRGERRPNSKLTESDVREIRSLKGALPHRKIAARFGVSESLVRRIFLRKNWGWLE